MSLPLIYKYNDLNFNSMHASARSLGPPNILRAKWGKDLGPRSLRSGTSQGVLWSLDSEEGPGAGIQTFEEGTLPGCADTSGRGNETGVRVLGKVQARFRFSFRNKLLLRSIASVTLRNRKQNRKEQIPFYSFKLAVILLWQSLVGSSCLRGRRVVYRIPASLSGA